jgi:hypothetical protein
MAGTQSGHTEDALSEIVGFVLILALVVVASTLYLLYVVPAEGREDEITHMNQVQDRFISYKTSIDGLWMRSLADLSVPGTRGVSLSTSFDLGTGGGNTQSTGLFLSFMKPIGTAARMRIDSNEGERIRVTIDGEPLYNNDDDGWVDIGSLNYTTDNYYWIQQSYLYELGGVFLEQAGEGVSVKIAPSLSLYGVQNGTVSPPTNAVKLSLCLVNLTDEDRTIGGTGPLRVETRLRESFGAPYRNKKADTIIVEIEARNGYWRDAWRQVLTDAVQQSGYILTSADLADVMAGSHEWFHIYNSDSKTVVLDIEHDGAEPAVSKDVYLDLTEAPLQVTFEYDEP